MTRAVSQLSLAEATSAAYSPRAFRADLAAAHTGDRVEHLRRDGGKIVAQVVRDAPRRYRILTYGY